MMRKPTLRGVELLAPGPQTGHGGSYEKTTI